jgi:DNA-binding NtrC family response regulator
MVTRVGDTIPVHTDFRIISSTNHDIEQRVAENKFRLDLFHRLNTLHIHIPPLRERPEDIRPLLIHFTESYAKKFNRPDLTLLDEVFKSLETYAFPGNIRELKNMVERAIILCKSSTLTVHDFPLKSQAQLPQAIPPEPVREAVNLKNHEIDLIRKALLATKFNQTAAADILGISRVALIRKMKKYNLTIGKIEN